MKETLRAIKQNVKETYLMTSQVYYNIAGSDVECNICHYKANKLTSDSWHLYCICPNCYSTVRHRLLVASLSLLNNFSFEKIIDGKNVLHFAPEKKLEKMIRSRASLYKTADFFTEGYSYKNIDFNLDISNMKTVADQSYDCVIACDVLEHVPDHIKAIQEVYRVLKPGGYCIFTVPQKDGLDVTQEDLTITDPKERERIFGQYDHLRIYGNDFVDILANCGFDVTAVNEEYFDKDTVHKYVLFPPVLSQNPLATNYRKVFFGKK
ncbi:MULTISPECIES: class I SAM-dependent methyltransferase [Spirosoma]|uniref:Class I SAM-dependent methyltransferase n=1 Tax=Spirosoma liriopis TaxID=2937440 RepID=A0ABT0HFP0_9BACT|nr:MULTISPECIES: class I SAM-dependent methyltransferase [Spirosoma]MCK8490964.1 class I SAM-dependent methyltransferase [Spirosoma liriopis]UHG90348.1 class I SAM-dependent methyltransferase [Spirosoma oryzicola]